MGAIAGEQLGRPAVEALPINTTSVMGWVAKTREPLNIPDVRRPPWSRVYYPLDHALQMRSELAVPLIGASGRLEGVLNLESLQPGAFSEADSHLLQGLATQAVIAIQDVRLLDTLQEMAAHLLTRPAQQVLDHLVALACDLLGGSASAIWLLDEEELTLQAASTGHVRGDKLSLHGSLTGQAILMRDCVISEDVRAEPRFGWPDLARTQGWTRALIVPLIAAADSEPVGAFSVYGSAADPGRFTASDWDKKVLTILAHYAALAVRNAANQAALRSAQEQRATAETFAAIGDIAANLLHRLNNKVGTIPVRVEGIEDKCAAALRADPYLAANLGEIGRSAREAMDTVRESLFHLQPMPLAPVNVAECAAAALAGTHLPEQVDVAVTGLDGLPAVIAHPSGLTLVFANLLENAADALGGAGQVAILGSSAARGGRDHRERQRAGHRDRAARKDFRAQLLGPADGARRQTGLRLVVGAHADDAAGRHDQRGERRAARHQLRDPPAVCPIDDARDRCSTREGNPMSQEPLRALVVEDDRSWQQIVTEILTDIGLAVDVADSVEKAVAALRATPHRLAVVDLSLVGADHRNQDGLTVLEAIRRQDPGCPAILLTGFATVELAVSALTEHGAYTCLRKETFRRAEFRLAIQRMLALAPGPLSTDAQGPAPMAPGGPDKRPAGAVGQALLVEDDAGWRSILAELLTDAGLPPRTCLSYGEALGLPAPRKVRPGRGRPVTRQLHRPRGQP